MEGGSERWKHLGDPDHFSYPCSHPRWWYYDSIEHAASFMRWMKEAARTTGMPQRMATFWLFFLCIIHCDWIIEVISLINCYLVYILSLHMTEWSHHLSLYELLPPFGNVVLCFRKVY
jgi:hypothetical protein